MVRSAMEVRIVASCGMAWGARTQRYCVGYGVSSMWPCVLCVVLCQVKGGGRCAITVLRVHGPRRPLPAAHKTPAAMDAVVCPVVAGRAACGNATIRICAALVGVSDYKDDADQVQKSARQRHCLVMASPAPDPSTAKPSERMARRGAGSLSEQHHI